MDKSISKKVIEIAQRFEAGLKDQGIVDPEGNLDTLMLFSPDDIYFLLCLVMPDPKSIVWGDPNMEWPGGKK